MPGWISVCASSGAHASITTTGKYLHTLPTADQVALTALDKIRKPRVKPASWRPVATEGTLVHPRWSRALACFPERRWAGWSRHWDLAVAP